VTLFVLSQKDDKDALFYSAVPNLSLWASQAQLDPIVATIRR
jgi:hypothetical protein